MTLPHESDTRPPHSVHTTDGLIEWWFEHSPWPREVIAVVLPAAIDAIYADRDAGGTMHSAGAAAAIAAMDAFAARAGAGRAMTLPRDSGSGPHLPDELVDAAIEQASDDFAADLAELARKLSAAAVRARSRRIYGLEEALLAAASSASSWATSLDEWDALG